MPQNIRQRIVQALGVIAFVFALGTVGFHALLDGLTLLDAFYLTVITLTTVGYGDLSPHTNMPADGNPYLVKIFTIGLILFGMSAFLYTVGIVTEYVVSGEMIRERRRRRMQRLIARLDRHYIVCGGGETGLHVLEELDRTGRPFVLVDRDPARVAELERRFAGLRYVVGDATEDATLHAAGLERAAGVALALPDEKDNLFVVVSLAPFSRERGDAFRIAALVEHWDRTAPKLRRAGADIVISPDYISGRRMVSEMFRPSVTTFLDRMLRDDRAVMRVEEAVVAPDAPVCGRTLGEAALRERTGLVIVAVRPAGEGDFVFCPGPDQPLAAGDALIALGEMGRIVGLRRLVGGKAGGAA
jgi:voltage-gated potassium channel